MDIEDTPQVRVAIRLVTGPAGLGAWLADGAAFDTAGAAALWLELGEDSDVDPWVVLGALAHATSRARLVLPVDPRDVTSPDGRRALATARQLGNDRLTLRMRPDGADEVAAALPGMPLLVDGTDPGEDVVEARTEMGDRERWLAVPVPADRAAWRETCVHAAAREATGVVVAADSVLLAILRNPRARGDRRDIHLAHG